jgi:hypothetical protein
MTSALYEAGRNHVPERQMTASLEIYDMSEMNCRTATSSAHRGWITASERPPGSRSGFELANDRTGINCDSAASIWTLTLGLVVGFLVSSFVAALLATHFGWLGPANAPL